MGGQPFMGGQPLMGGQHLMEDDICWKTLFDGKGQLLFKMYAMLAFIPLIPFLTLCQALPIQSSSSFLFA